MYCNLQSLVGLIDLTSLNDHDNAETISALCHKALSPFGHVAAVCVYPRFVSQAKKILAAAPVKIATVVNFPEGNAGLDDVLSAIRQAIQDGANEIDVVFPYSDYLRGEKEKALNFIRQCKATAGEDIVLKVIIETGALVHSAVIAEVSYEVAHAGADFLKTSTGKIAVGATLDAARVMFATIKKIARPIGIKISGGVRTIEQAEQYVGLAQQMMGADWVTPGHFRIGASQLLDALRDALRVPQGERESGKFTGY